MINKEINVFIYSENIYCLLYARHISKTWGNSSEHMKATLWLYRAYILLKRHRYKT